MTDPTQLQKCTVRIDISGSRGTGFFVAPQLILTCAHVVGENQSINLFWKVTQQNYTATVQSSFPYPIDLALLKLEIEHLDHPCVELDISEPDSQDKLHIFGYPRDQGIDYPDGDSVTFDYGGQAFKEEVKLYNLQSGRILEGFSGSPLLNLTTGKIVGIVHLSHDTTTDLGGRAISNQVIFQKYPFLKPNGKPTDTNPFQYGAPVAPELFYGREKAILDLKNRIGAITPQSINIVGFRRSGKTSLLRYIRECPNIFFQDHQQPLIVNLDLQSKKFHTPEGILEGLRREVTKLIGNEPWCKHDNNDDFAIEDGLQCLVDRKYRLIVMLDEFEAISQYLEQFQGWGDDWRAKASAGLLTMVIASKRPLEEIYHNVGVGSPFGNIFSRTILGALESKAWQQLITDGFNKKPPLLRGVGGIKWIENLAGGLPFYTQMAGSILWQYQDFAEAEKEFQFQAQPRFQELWNDLTAPEQQALRYTLNIGAIPKPSNSIMDNLKRHGLVTENNTIFSSIFTEFIQDNLTKPH